MKFSDIPLALNKINKFLIQEFLLKCVKGKKNKNFFFWYRVLFLLSECLLLEVLLFIILSQA